MPNQLVPAEELQNRVSLFLKDYFLTDFHKDRDSFYALTHEDFLKFPLTVCGVALNLFMDGELDKADRIIESLPDEGYFPFIKIGLKLVHPKITWEEFINLLHYLKENKISLQQVSLTAGRPTLLNGVNDFTRIGPLLKTHKDLFIEDLRCLYNSTVCPAIYNLCLAEYYYQLNNLIESEVLVSRTIKEFDKESEHRLLFAALYLQAKIQLAYGKTVSPNSYIKNIRNHIKENGKAEFSYNIEAAEVLSGLYEGDLKLINEWLKNDAPDEFADFNMIDVNHNLLVPIF